MTIDARCLVREPEPNNCHPSMNQGSLPVYCFKEERYPEERGTLPSRWLSDEILVWVHRPGHQTVAPVDTNDRQGKRRRRR